VQIGYNVVGLPADVPDGGIEDFAPADDPAFHAVKFGAPAVDHRIDVALIFPVLHGRGLGNPKPFDIIFFPVREIMGNPIRTLEVDGSPDAFL
jgi:hypothetical protein